MFGDACEVCYHIFSLSMVCFQINVMDACVLIAHSIVYEVCVVRCCYVRVSPTCVRPNPPRGVFFLFILSDNVFLMWTPM